MYNRFIITVNILSNRSSVITVDVIHTTFLREGIFFTLIKNRDGENYLTIKYARFPVAFCSFKIFAEKFVSIILKGMAPYSGRWLREMSRTTQLVLGPSFSYIYSVYVYNPTLNVFFSPILWFRKYVTRKNDFSGWNKSAITRRDRRLSVIKLNLALHLLTLEICK